MPARPTADFSIVTSGLIPRRSLLVLQYDLQSAPYRLGRRRDCQVLQIRQILIEGGEEQDRFRREGRYGWLIDAILLPILIGAMSAHPLNLALRFVLELRTLFAPGYWGWTQPEGILRVVSAFAVSLTAVVFLGVFSTPGDRSRSAGAIMSTPGILRLAMELLFFAAAAWSFYVADIRVVAFVFAGIVLLHYGLSCDRIAWLVKN
jgi:hypothetical protein